MNTKLFLEAIIKFFLGLIIVGLLIFLPAGSLEYRNGWLLICLLFIPMFMAGIALMIKNPTLLKSRLDAKEKENEQKDVLKYSAIMFILGFIVAGLNYRYQFIMLPEWIVIVASVLFLIAYLLYAEVLRENTYLSRTIGVVANQKVIDTGMYKIVRHPMYAVTVLLFLMMPLILNSLISFIIFLVYPFIIVKRIKNEEIILGKELKGYKEYKEKVKYRLISYIW